MTRDIHNSDLQLGVVAGIEELGALDTGVLVLDTSMPPQKKRYYLDNDRIQISHSSADQSRQCNQGELHGEMICGSRFRGCI